MKKIIYPILFFLFTNLVTLAKSSMEKDEIKIWNQINETTWRKNDNWAGEGYTFYESNDRIKRCLVQTYGSGVYVTHEEFYQIEVKNEIINLLKKDSLSTYFIFESFTLTDKKLKSVDKKYELNLYSSTPLIYNFEKRSSDKKISIEEIKNKKYN